MWFDNAIKWFQQHRAPLGGIVGFVAGVLLVLDKFYDFKILDVAIALVGLTSTYLIGAGTARSDQWHKEKEEYLKGGDRRRNRQKTPPPSSYPPPPDDHGGW